MTLLKKIILNKNFVQHVRNDLQVCPLADSLRLWPDTYLAAVVILLEFSPKMWLIFSAFDNTIECGLMCCNLGKYAALM